MQTDLEATPEQLKDFTDMKDENFSTLEWINISKMLTCDKCKILYGCKTEESNQDCIDNFIQFCSEEV